MNLLSFSSLSGPEIIILLLLVPLLMVFALVQCLTATFSDSTQKLIWVLVILLMPLLGSVLWFTMGKKQISPR